MYLSLISTALRLSLLSTVTTALPSPENSRRQQNTANETTQNIAFDYSPSREYDPKNHLAIVNLFKRGCTLPQGGLVCNDGATCCYDPSQDDNGWCCGAGKLCASGENEVYCSLSTIHTTITTTKFNIITDRSTQTKTITQSASVKTESSTTIVTVTASDVETATSVVTVTATRPNAKRGALASFPTATLSSSLEKRQSAVLPRETLAPQHQPQSHHNFGLRDLFPRQDSAEPVTSTETITVEKTSTTSTRLWSTSFVKDVSTTTVVSTVTFTSAVNAKTTVTSTFTLTVDSTEPVSSSGTVDSTGGALTTTDPTGTGAAQATQSSAEGVTKQNSDSGLSTGAKAGIGIGIAFIAVIGMLGVAFILYKRRQQNGQAASKIPSPPPTATKQMPAVASGDGSAAIAITSDDEKQKPKQAQDFFAPVDVRSNPASPAPPYQQPYQHSYQNPHPESYEMYTPAAANQVPNSMTHIPHNVPEMPGNNSTGGWGYNGNAAEMPGSGATR